MSENMRELNERDIKILTKGFLKTLNELVNGDEDKCIESVNVFNSTELRAFEPIVIPHVVQELVHQGLIKECETKGQVKITKKGKNRLNRTIDSNVDLILQTLATHHKDDLGRVSLPGNRLQELTDLTPIEINDAVELLEQAGLVKTLKFLGTHPFNFHHVELTPRGRYEYERQLTRQSPATGEETKVSEGKRISLRPAPAGSPFGFTDIDWEIVIESNRNRGKLYVVFGYKFESQYYHTDNLVKNIHKMFEDTIDKYIEDNPDSPKIDLFFKTLSAGYGQHLFNQIARDIISADIVVFDTSDLNPNVMIEVGVALTWGVRVLLIKEKTASKQPSDISGQTWAEYTKDGMEFTSGHKEKLLSMVEFAIRKKRSS
jgi:hypothetical protein